MENRLSDQLNIKVSSTLKYMLAYLGQKLHAKPAEMARLALHLFVEKYSDPQNEDSFYQELGRLQARDAFAFWRGAGKDGVERRELNAEDAERMPRTYSNPNYVPLAPTEIELEQWTHLGRMYLAAGDKLAAVGWLAQVRDVVREIPAGHPLAEVVKQVEDMTEQQ